MLDGANEKEGGAVQPFGSNGACTPDYLVQSSISRCRLNFFSCIPSPIHLPSLPPMAEDGWRREGAFCHVSHKPTHSHAAFLPLATTVRKQPYLFSQLKVDSSINLDGSDLPSSKMTPSCWKCGITLTTTLLVPPALDYTHLLREARIVNKIMTDGKTHLETRAAEIRSTEDHLTQLVNAHHEAREHELARRGSSVSFAAPGDFAHWLNPLFGSDAGCRTWMIPTKSCSPLHISTFGPPLLLSYTSLIPAVADGNLGLLSCAGQHSAGSPPAGRLDRALSRVICCNFTAPRFSREELTSVLCSTISLMAGRIACPVIIFTADTFAANICSCWPTDIVEWGLHMAKFQHPKSHKLGSRARHMLRLKDKGIPESRFDRSTHIRMHTGEMRQVDAPSILLSVRLWSIPLNFLSKPFTILVFHSQLITRLILSQHSIDQEYLPPDYLNMVIVRVALPCLREVILGIDSIDPTAFGLFLHQHHTIEDLEYSVSPLWISTVTGRGAQGA
ncbi:hypothetical protein C8R47DRAFT_1192384 [Mycena vitilis]|nr:hypothetical protein C8R47DRAFT_1192384 [Mycena vitilis]